MIHTYPGTNGFLPTYFPPQGGETDPLAEYAWDIRFQTHRGDNVPRWLWQDEEMTVPSVNDFDPICVWEDISGNGYHAVQLDPDKQPVLSFVNGVPVTLWDGVDDRMVLDGPGGPNPALISFVTRRADISSWQGAIGYGGPTGQGPMLYSRISGSTSWGGYFDGILLPGQTNEVFKVLSAAIRDYDDIDFVTDGVVNNITTGNGYYTGSGSQLGGEATGFTCLNGEMACLMAGPVSIPRATTDALIATLYADILGS